MKRRISAFISASSEKQDRRVVEWFFGILRKLEIDPISATDLPEPRPPPEKIMDFIQKSDLFIAIVTKRHKIERKNLWKGPDWVQNEIGVAVQLKKPFALFVERGIDPNQGIGRWKTEYIIFDRSNLQKSRSKAEKFIEALKKRAANKVHSRAIEEAETSGFEESFIRVGRFLIEHAYGRLDVSLWKTYSILAVLSTISAYFVYDYNWGAKIVGLWGYTISLAIIIASLTFAASAEGTRCRNCGSYSGVRERPVLASDIRKLPTIPDDRRYHKFMCDVCGNTRYKARSRKSQDN